MRKLRLCNALSFRRYQDGVRWGSREPDLPHLAHVRIALIGCSVGVGDIDQAMEVYATQQRLAPGYTQSRLEGRSVYGQAQDRQRMVAFLRIAAGLDDPAGAAAWRQQLQPRRVMRAPKPSSFSSTRS